MTTAFLVGKKTILRPVHPTDAPIFTKWINNPETRKYLSRRLPATEFEEVKWIEKLSDSDPSPNNIVMVIETKRGRTPIGTMGLHGISWIDRHATTGTIIGEAKLRGKGYASDAKMTLLGYAFETLGLHKITSRAFTDNKASIAYSKKCGYTVEAVLKEEIFLEGAWKDIAILACFYEGWKKAQQKNK